MPRMSTKTAVSSNAPVIESRQQLLDYFAGGEKPAERWRIGTEHEKFVYSTKDCHAPSYDEPGGIRDLLAELTQFGWKPVTEGDNVIALSGPDGTVSLEPAGQLELSGAPLENLHQTCAETGRHLQQVKAVGEKLGLGFLGLGVQPPTPEWGTMLASARDYIERAWWVVSLPGLTILLSVLAINLMGDGLRDALDPKLKNAA